MQCKILDGRIARDKIAEALRRKISGLKEKSALSIIQVGGRPDSTAYVNAKKKFGESIGAIVNLARFPENVSESEIISEIGKLNKDKNIRGIIVQLPLPAQFNKTKILNSVAAEKDVDGLSEKSAENLRAGRAGFAPATAIGIISLLDFYKIPIAGKKAVVINDSILVGKPLQILLARRGADAILCNDRTKNLAEIAREADILISATGVPKLIGKDFVKAGQVVIDVGFGTDKDGKVSGDVDFEAVKNIAGAVSPVPGGAGPMTVASLFENLLAARQNQV